MLVQPPFNYTGSKYRLLPQLMPMFDYSRPTLVDLFTGGGSVWCNLVPYFERMIANDIIRNLIEAQQALLDGDAIISETKALCVDKDDKPGYHRLPCWACLRITHRRNSKRPTGRPSRERARTTLAGITRSS